MAGFTDHLDHARSNLKFLSDLSRDHAELWDWKITVAYYSALHLVNAFVADKYDLHPDSHEKLKEILHPESRFKDIRLDEKTHTGYNYLEMLSRRARYLCDVNSGDNNAHRCNGKHFTASVKQLDMVMRFFKSVYNSDFDTVSIHSTHTEKTNGVKYFEFTNSSMPKRDISAFSSQAISVKKGE